MLTDWQNGLLGASSSGQDDGNAFRILGTHMRRAYHQYEYVDASEGYERWQMYGRSFQNHREIFWDGISIGMVTPLNGTRT